MNNDPPPDLMWASSDRLDPDRPARDDHPGSQEWWYFDAIGNDGRDALVIVWYFGLPFDPRYGLAAIRHAKKTSNEPGPHPLDHCGVGLSWYRDGKVVAYALNTYPRAFVSIQDDPFSVAIGPSLVSRSDNEYRLRLRLPDLQSGQRIIADLTFQPKLGCRPFSRDLGGNGSPHHWDLAAADMQVDGEVEIDKTGKRVTFLGRGYHDHNHGTEELSLAWKNWAWDRVHFGDRTVIHYEAEPRNGDHQILSILCENGDPVHVEESHPPRVEKWQRTPLGIQFPALAEFGSDDDSVIPRIRRRHRDLVDSGPFYLRWLSEFEVDGVGKFLGISEQLDGDRLHSRWFNWMIPYRLKRPRG